MRYPLFEVFDKPDGNASCPRRNQSTIAPQSLLLLNGDDSVRAARQLAAWMNESADNRDAKIELTYRRVLGRQPTADELHEAAEFLSSPEVTWADFCLALFNLNEFVYVD